MVREDYFCSEGRFHYNENDMCGYYVLRPPDIAPKPPMFINYTIKEEVNREDIKDYVQEVMDNKINIITNLVYTKLQQDVNLSVQEAVQQAFLELGVLSKEDIDTITQE